MAVGGLLLFDAGEGLAYERVVERVEQRIHLIPRYRQRLREAAPGITHPVWADDHAFDVGWHVRRTRVATEDELLRFAGHEMSRRLDRSRPLWELTVVEGLEDGRAALLAKMHHALVDGVAAVDIGTVLLDPSPEPLDLPDPGEWTPRRYDRRRHLAQLATKPAARAQRLLADAFIRTLEADPLRAAGDLRKATELVVQLARTRPAAPMTPLNRELSPNRRYATVTAPLAAIKATAKGRGATVNDVLLTAVAGTLARILPETGAEPVALVPVSGRREGEEGGNRISTVLVDLPVGVEDPFDRLEIVNATMTELKASAAVRAGAVLAGAAGWAPPLVSSGLARAMGGVRAFNVVVSNVPGPQQPFYLDGCRLLQAFPCVPLNPANQNLTVGILSYDGTVCFGLLADRELDPPVWEVAAALSASLAELAG
jgi:WS/DGAT/MGAT family acyltransferase